MVGMAPTLLTGKIPSSTGLRSLLEFPQVDIRTVRRCRRELQAQIKESSNQGPGVRIRLVLFR